MSATVSPTQSDIFTALGAVLDTFGLIPSNPAQPVAIIQGQVNRVPEPPGPDFVALWPITRNRLAMNIDDWTDAQLTGSITGNVLTVTAVLEGFAAPGQTIYGAGVTAGCQIGRQLTGSPGGPGTYQTTPTAPVGSRTLYTGTKCATQKTEITIQADVHGPASADNAARIATLFRDQFGVDAFQAQGFDISPLYTSDPRQMPFVNGEQQVEDRWVIDLCMQANVVVTVTQQFADQLEITTTPAQTLAA